MLRFWAEGVEVVLLRSKSEKEESAPSWNMSPSGSLCQRQCLQKWGTVPVPLLQEAWPQ